MLTNTARAIVPLLLAGSLSAQIGAVLGTFPTPAGTVPVGLGTDNAGTLYMTTTTRDIYQLSASGSVIRNFSAATNTGISNGVCSDGTNIFVTDASGAAATGGRGIDVYDMAGTYVRTFPTVAAYPSGICWNPTNNHLYVVDRTGSASVYEYDLAGAQIAVHGLNGTSNDGVAYDVTTNSYWVYEAGAGDLMHNYDSSWTETQTFPGTVAAVGSAGRGIAVISGVLYAVAQSARTIVMFDTSGTLAAVTSYGSGCPQRGVFYELFTATGNGDLAGISFRFASTGGNGWNAGAGGTFETNLGTNLMMADDQILRGQALGFSWPVPGSANGATNSIDISSNGWVGLRTGQIPDTGFAVTESGAEFVKYERIAAWWDDLDPSQAGGVYFNTLSNPQRAIITWSQVPQFGAQDSNTIQLQMFANGDMVMVWQAGCVDDALTGFSSGANAPDPGSIDLTATLPRRFGPYGAPLTLDSGRPVLGTAIVYTVTNIPGNASLGAILFGNQQLALPLDTIGMEGCTLLTNGNLATGPISLQTGQLNFFVPNNPGLIGAQLYHQAVVLAGGFNSLGAIASNGLRFKLGT